MLGTQEEIHMNLWKRLVALFRRKTGSDEPVHPPSRRELLDEEVRGRMRRIDSRFYNPLQ